MGSFQDVSGLSTTRFAAVKYEISLVCIVCTENSSRRNFLSVLLRLDEFSRMSSYELESSSMKKFIMSAEFFIYIITVLSQNNTPPFDRPYFFQKWCPEHNVFMERRELFRVRCPTSIQDPSRHLRPIPAEFSKFFPDKKRVFLWSRNGQNLHSWDRFQRNIYKLNKGFWPPRPRWSRALFSASDQWAFESLPLDGCSKRSSQRFSTWPLLLLAFSSILSTSCWDLKIFLKFGLAGLTVVAPRGISVLCRVLSHFKIEQGMETYPCVLAHTGINLNIVFCHESHQWFRMKFWVVVHDQQFQTIFLAPGKDLVLEDFKHHRTIYGFVLEVTFLNELTVPVAGSVFVLHLVRVEVHDLI